MIYLISSLSAWFAAQVIKVIITAVGRKKLDLYAFFASGGMPSSHTALVTALTINVGMHLGFGSIYFAICAVFSMVIMYDAAGVRRSVGEQAKKINQLLDEYYNSHELDNAQLGERIAEILGHTPREVLAGFLLGVLFGILI